MQGERYSKGADTNLDQTPPLKTHTYTWKSDLDLNLIPSYVFRKGPAASLTNWPAAAGRLLAECQIGRKSLGCAGHACEGLEGYETQQSSILVETS